MFRSDRGSAYVLVIVAALAMVLTALTITAASRNITARYADFYGLYDVAAAGNERAFAALKNNTHQNFFTPGLCWHLYAIECISVWRYEWTFDINFDDTDINFFATSTICERGVQFPCREICPRLRKKGWPETCVRNVQCGHGPLFYIETRVRKNAPDAPVAVVRKSAIFLDCNTPVMLELYRIAN